ncbi:hypothetical protein I6G82_10120 [Lysinibacillus macroides]|uniref:hypothetical protein n=1 Tax=Lysinibacillus macroides TaxID=33935 RepID=UPI00128FC175|nr:hypothetical protein [Lysinibacillus macroides]QPR69893.1 hypothetical protein I6G82_10120 [Lysinibacillus macroides]
MLPIGAFFVVMYLCYLAQQKMLYLMSLLRLELLMCKSSFAYQEIQEKQLSMFFLGEATVTNAYFFFMLPCQSSGSRALNKYIDDSS